MEAGLVHGKRQMTDGLSSSDELEKRDDDASWRLVEEKVGIRRRRRHSRHLRGESPVGSPSRVVVGF